MTSSASWAPVDRWRPWRRTSPGQASGSASTPPRRGTVGGAVATAATGPNRLHHGSVRDLVIGMTLVRADGVVAHAGGKVVKNVAGYDLGKLLTGSFGTLGVITEVAFRLHPAPRGPAVGERSGGLGRRHTAAGPGHRALPGRPVGCRARQVRRRGNPQPPPRGDRPGRRGAHRAGPRPCSATLPAPATSRPSGGGLSPPASTGSWSSSPTRSRASRGCWTLSTGPVRQRD